MISALSTVLSSRPRGLRPARISLLLASAGALVLPAGTAPGAEAGRGDWSFVLGGGALVAPSYEGSDKFSVSPMPFVSINWRDRVFLEMGHGLGVNVVRTDALRLGVSVGFAPGRDEDDDDHLKGLGDIDTAARGHVFGSYAFGMLQLGVDVAKDFGGSDGVQVRPELSVKVPLSESWTLSSGISATWADDAYMQSFFGVSASQSRSSGLERFDAGAGFKSVDLQLGLNWAITESWFATAHLGVGVLLGDAADSPVTESRVQPSAALAVGYRF